MLTRRNFLGALAVAGAAALVAPAPASSGRRKPRIDVRKNVGCGCCDGWADHMTAAGFDVRVTEDANLTAYKTKLGVPRALHSCHTGEVEGYVVEGHVPADLVQRMITEKPGIVGIGVGGMPIGSPGMEVPGRAADRYDVIAFTKSGRQAVYARR